MRRHVVIGNGGAAISAVRAIRSVTAEDEITLISQEDGPAYSPMLLPYYLAGHIRRRDLFICNQDFYRAHRVQELLGHRIIKVDTRNRTVLLEDNSTVSFDNLLIATGASAVKPSVPGIDLPGVFCLRTLRDTQSILRAFKNVRTVLFIGGGLLSLEVAQALFRKDLRMTFLISSHHILSQNMDREGARIMQKHLEQRGISFLKDDDVKSVEKKKGILLMTTRQGQELLGDMVVVGKGVRSNSDMVQGNGINVNNGIIVDDTMCTSEEGIYAAGDVAEGIDIATGRAHVNATWPNAVSQGWTAGLNMAGKKTSYLRNVRVNICALFGLPFASIGVVKADEREHQLLASRSDGRYWRLVFKNEVLVGAVLVGDVTNAGIMANLVEQQKPCPDLKKKGQKGMSFIPFAKNLIMAG